MHSYLRAIGFSKLEQKDLDQILQEVIVSCDEKKIAEQGKNEIFAELSRYFGMNIGLRVCGTYDEQDQFRMEYYFPYFVGSGITSQEDVMVEQRSEKVCFSGACDDVRVGVTLIFYLANAGEYLTERTKGTPGEGFSNLTLSGLSTEGKILLPIQKNIAQRERDQQLTRKRTQMIYEARRGNEEAMENLTMDDMDTYAMISRRIANEDIFSIVDTYFMPYGMECDRYNVMGEILEWMETTNKLTGEKLYQMTINCNDLIFDICMNQEDLMGIPEVGRRFKGIIWLQGSLNF